MTDRELLEAAAKAAGIDPDRIDVCQRENGPNPYIEPWKPLTDDGDALRLAGKLRIWLDYGGCSDEDPAHITARYLTVRGRNSTQRWVTVAYIPESMFQRPKDKKYATFLMEQGEHVCGFEPATRRAIVRAAAEIGRAK